MIDWDDQAMLIGWLREEDPARLRRLWAAADQARFHSCGAAVHLRGLIEISNSCVRQCGYCGLRAGNGEVRRYRMSADEILAAARQAADLGYGTVVLQAGEDPGLSGPWMANVIRGIKRETSLAVTLSLGERTEEECLAWREAGADRYLLRFETSDLNLYRRVHPPRAVAGTPFLPEGPSGLRLPVQAAVEAHPRVMLLRRLRELGYEIGSGILAGLPGQNHASLADDLRLFRALDLDMIGIGPFIAHPATPLARRAPEPRDAGASGQVPATELMVHKLNALTRLACPEANIPSTTALATINRRNGRELGLQRGANVVMPNLTPMPYRKWYEIYPGKACIDETGQQCDRCLSARLASIGRRRGRGPGGRQRRGPEFREEQLWRVANVA